jgi:apolipoprotein N-acyltransferase
LKIFFWRNRIPFSEEARNQRKKERRLLSLSGFLLALSFPPIPFPAPLLLFVALIPYLIVIEKKENLIEINRATYLMAFIFCLFTLYWVGSWQKEADPFLMISGILLIFVNPVFFLIPSTLLYFSRKVFPQKYSLYFLPIFYAAYEFAYMLTDLSFPWLSLGNGLSLFTSFIQIADIIGQLGLTIVIVMLNVLLYKSLISFRANKKLFFINLSAALFIFFFILIYGMLKLNSPLHPHAKVKVGLIQPNLDPWEKWKGHDLNQLTELYLDLSIKAVNDGAKIIIWPETALPIYLRGGTYEDIQKRISDFCDSNQVFLLTGMPDIRFYYDVKNIPDDAKYSSANDYYYATYNSILLFRPNNLSVDSYGKMKLVPFGERVPFVDALPFLGKLIKWGVGLSSWNVGKDTTVFYMPLQNIRSAVYNDTIKIGGIVCYESIYPTLVSEFVKRKADFIAVVTNDSWYGNLSGPYQHKEFAALRAVENRRTIVRAANGGISCIINPFGRTEVQTKMFNKNYIVGDVVLNNSETFFTNHSLLIPILCSAFSIWIIGIFTLMKLKKYLKL